MDDFLPYKLFTYVNGDHHIVLRPEQVIAFATGRLGSYPAVPGVQDTRSWGVRLNTRDGQGQISVDFGDDRNAMLEFIHNLRTFIEQDAVRNTHNAALRKGKVNG